MAKGDTVIFNLSMATTTTAIYSPAGTTEILVRTLIGQSTLIEYSFGSGTSSPVIAYGNALTSVINVSCFINSSFPLKITNGTGGTRSVGFTGIETK